MELLRDITALTFGAYLIGANFITGFVKIIK